MPNKHPRMRLSREEETFLRHWIYDEAHYQEGTGPAKRLQLQHRARPADVAILIAAGFRSPVGWAIDPAARGTACAVARQEPAAGAQFQRGDSARLFLVGGKDCGKKSD